MNVSKGETPCAQKLKALADQTRLAVLESLMRRPKRVWEMCEELNLDQSLLSHHLRTLRDYGLVETQRDGKSILYRLADGVGRGAASDTIDLGCCTLSFRSSGDLPENNS